MRGEVEMNPLHVNMLVGGCGRGAELGRRRGGGLLVGGRGKVPIETNRAIPSHGGASRADFAKVSPGHGGAGKCTHLEQVQHFSEFLPTS